MQKLAKWQRTKLGLLVFALIELGVAYGFASLAIARGNLLWYLLALVFLIGTLQNLFKLIGAFLRGKWKTG